MERLRGIVLRTVKYGDGGHIVDMYTNARGRMSFMMKRTAAGSTGHTRCSSRVLPSCLLPLSMLEFDCDIHGQARLPQPKDVRPYHVCMNTQTNPVKGIITMFIAEFLQNALKDEAASPLLYEYIEDSLKWLDSCERGYANFHLVFLIRMTRFLGIYPSLDKANEFSDWHHERLYYYDLMNSEYRLGQPNHPHYLKPDEASRIPYLLYMDYENMHLYRFSRHQRTRCLEVINDYYRLHLPGFSELKSLEVFKELFD